MREDALLLFPRMRTLHKYQWLNSFYKHFNEMVKICTKFSFGLSLEARKGKETVRKRSKVLTVAKEIIRTRLSRRKDSVDSG